MQKKAYDILALLFLAILLAGCATGEAKKFPLAVEGREAAEQQEPKGEPAPVEAMEESAPVEQREETPEADVPVLEPAEEQTDMPESEEEEVEYVEVETEKEEAKPRDIPVSPTLRKPAIQKTRKDLEQIDSFGYGTIIVISQPEDADAFVGGVFVGKTPVTLKNYQIGSYTIKLQKTGYDFYFSNFYLANAENETINVTLNQTAAARLIGGEEEETSETYIDSNPQLAFIYLNGKYTGKKTPMKFDLKPGIYTIKLEKGGYELYTAKITVEARKAQRVYAKLIPELIPGLNAEAP
ncbi:PEGA domain-containing protein [Candidatus Woesearchaeota archaeon]|nr:PEGA domain-containing protein [Candidatus Woesearchaeota archaeon]